MKCVVTFDVVFVKSRCTTVLILKRVKKNKPVTKRRKSLISQAKEQNDIIKQFRSSLCFSMFMIITSSCIRLGQEDREEKSSLWLVRYRRERKG